MKLKLIKVKQKHLEAFDEELQDTTVHGAATLMGVRVRAAIRVGWYGDSVSEDIVDDMDGKEVTKLHDEITDLYNEATTIDPN